MKRNVICLVLFVVLFLWGFNVKAATTTSRLVITMPVGSLSKNVRPEPKSSLIRLGYAINYGIYNLVDETPYASIDGDKTCATSWYKIYYNGTATGYVCGENTEILRSYATDDVSPTTDCEKEMLNLGFPSSYWAGLCRLKEKHPTWKFEALKVNLDWSEVIKGESPCGWNLISDSSSNAGFIDETCTTYEGSGYMGVLPQGIAFYMDPRNFLAEAYIFQFQKLSYSDSLENDYAKSIETMLANTSFYKYHKDNDFANSIVNAAKEMNVCPIFTSARIKQELGPDEKLVNLYSGTGVYTDDAGVTYTGYYNFYNIGVSDSCVKDFGRTYCGLRYAVNKGWNNLSSAIKGGINMISVEYINKNQYTTYLQKFNVLGYDTRKPYSHQYQTNIAAPSSESSMTYKSFEQKGLESPFIFSIPVYNNMNATIDNSGNGAVDSGDGTAPKPSTIPIHTIVTSSGYKYESGYISGVALGTDVHTLKGSLESVGGNSTVVVTNLNGEAVLSGVIGTGFKVSINNQSTTEVLEVVVKGDTSGDGIVNALDLLQIQKSILGTYTLTGGALKAGDTSSDGVVNALDLLQVQKHILGTYTIE